MLVCASVFAFGISTPSALAQLDIGLRSADVTVSMSPEIPGPNQDVTVSISSFSVDLNKTMIIWKKAGEMLKSGVGEKSIVVKTGAIGTGIQLDVTILNGGTSLVKSIAVVPSEMDLLWETTDSYAPPFYKGKILPVKESTVKVVAITNTAGTELSQNDLVYSWKRNYNALPGSSGYRKNSVLIKLNYLENTQTVEATGTALSGGLLAQKQLVLRASDPYIRYYENNPDLGVLFNKTLRGTVSTTRNDFEVLAMPFAFSLKNIESGELVYQWTVGGKSVPTSGIKHRLTVQFPQGVTGSVPITTKIESALKLFQSANDSFNIAKK